MQAVDEHEAHIVCPELSQTSGQDDSSSGSIIAANREHREKVILESTNRISKDVLTISAGSDSFTSNIRSLDTGIQDIPQPNTKQYERIDNHTIDYIAQVIDQKQNKVSNQDEIHLEYENLHNRSVDHVSSEEIVLETYESSETPSAISSTSEEESSDMNIEIHDVRTEIINILPEEDQTSTGEAEDLLDCGIKTEPSDDDRILYSAEVTVQKISSTRGLQVYTDQQVSPTVEPVNRPAGDETQSCTQTFVSDDFPQLKVTLLDISTLPEINKLWSLSSSSSQNSDTPSFTVDTNDLDSITSLALGTNTKLSPVKTSGLSSGTRKTWCKEDVNLVTRDKRKTEMVQDTDIAFQIKPAKKRRGRPPKNKPENSKNDCVSFYVTNQEPVNQPSYLGFDLNDDNCEDWLSEYQETIDDSSEDEYLPSPKVKPKRRKNAKLQRQPSVYRKKRSITNKCFYISNRDQSKADNIMKEQKKIGRPPVIGEYNCKLCDFVAKEKNLVIKHQAKNHMLLLIHCRFCEFTSRSRNVMMEHEARKHTNEKPFKCQHAGCDYASKCKNDLNRHQSKHAEEKTHKCPHCDFITKWNRNIRHHMLKHTSKRPYSCDICGFSFKRMQDLKYHLFRHNDEKPIKCEQCDFRCKTNFEIKCHRLKHSDIRYFPCTFAGCTLSAKTKSDLTKHMQIHSTTRDHVCDICQKSFKTKASLKKHQSGIHVNPGRKPFQCHICNKSFRVKAGLRNHIRLHEGIKPFKCEVCGKDFSNKSNMQVHMKTHNSEGRPYQCPICPYGATNITQLLAHIGFMHGDSYAYFCELCRKPFKRYGQLQTHYKRMHSKEELARLDREPKLLDLSLCNFDLKFDPEAIKVGEPKRKRGRPRKYPRPTPETVVIKTEPVEPVVEDGTSPSPVDKVLSSDVNNQHQGSKNIHRKKKKKKKKKTGIQREKKTGIRKTLCSPSSKHDELDDHPSDNCERPLPSSQETDEDYVSSRNVNDADLIVNEIETIHIMESQDSDEMDSDYSNTVGKRERPSLRKRSHEDSKPGMASASQTVEQEKAATLLKYDGLRLPLATKGFHFNFDKTGKKPNCWFMASQYMTKSAAQKQEAYLRKKGLAPKQITKLKKKIHLSKAKERRVQILSREVMTAFIQKRRKRLNLPETKTNRFNVAKPSLTEAMVDLAVDYNAQYVTQVKDDVNVSDQVEFETLTGQRLSETQVSKLLPISTVEKEIKVKTSKKIEQACPVPEVISSKKNNGLSEKKPKIKQVTKCDERVSSSVKSKRPYVKKTKTPLLSSEKRKIKGNKGLKAGKPLQIRKPNYLLKGQHDTAASSSTCTDSNLIGEQTDTAGVGNTSESRPVSQPTEYRGESLSKANVKGKKDKPLKKSTPKGNSSLCLGKQQKSKLQQNLKMNSENGRKENPTNQKSTNQKSTKEKFTKEKFMREKSTNENSAKKKSTSKTMKKDDSKALNTGKVQFKRQYTKKKKNDVQLKQNKAKTGGKKVGRPAKGISKTSAKQKKLSQEASSKVEKNQKGQHNKTKQHKKILESNSNSDSQIVTSRQLKTTSITTAKENTASDDHSENRNFTEKQDSLITKYVTPVNPALTDIQFPSTSSGLSSNVILQVPSYKKAGRKGKAHVQQGLSPPDHSDTKSETDDDLLSEPECVIQPNPSCSPTLVVAPQHTDLNQVSLATH